MRRGAKEGKCAGGEERTRERTKRGKEQMGKGASVSAIHPSSFEPVACESVFVAELVMTAGEKRLRDLKMGWWM